MARTRTIIVVWSWQSGGQGEGALVVQNDRHPEDKVICKDVKAAEPNALEGLLDLVRTHTRFDGEVLLFLHRHHGYHQDHINQLLQFRLPEGHGHLRCFLFGEGADAIYLTNDPRGLLGTSGTFTARLLRDGAEIHHTSLADADGQYIKPAHFDYIWQLYHLEKRRKIIELREELMSFLMGHFSTPLIPAGAVYPLLNEPANRLLLLRLLSLCGRIRKQSELATEFRTFERKLGKSLEFEGFHPQLEVIYGAQAAAAFAALSGFILRNLLGGSTQVDMLTLRSLFSNLLEQIPENDHR
ncbi:MAG: hypothetical protein R2795_01915 [Saprospiraceae bacterium]